MHGHRMKMARVPWTEHQTTGKELGAAKVCCAMNRTGA